MLSDFVIFKELPLELQYVIMSYHTTTYNKLYSKMKKFKDIRKNPNKLKYIKHQTPEICKVALKNDGLTLKYVKNKTYDMCIIALKENGLALEFVNESEQTNNICMIAVKQNGLALKFVKKQNTKICIEAIRKNINAISYINPLTEDIRNAAFKYLDLYIDYSIEYF